MRLFVAIDLDAAARAASSQCARDLARRVDADPTSPSVRWVAEEQPHFTVCFLGDVPAPQIEDLRSGLRESWCVGAFTASLEGVDVFPFSGPACVIWLGMGDGRDQLHALRGELAGRLSRCGLETPSGPFRPHLTLGRANRTVTDSGTALRSLVRAQVAPNTRWRVDRVSLYESRLSPGGSAYRVVECESLRGTGGKVESG